MSEVLAQEQSDHLARNGWAEGERQRFSENVWEACVTIFVWYLYVQKLLH